MSFEKYGNKLINLLDKIEKKLNPTLSQIGGGDGPESKPRHDDMYIKILSYSIYHISILVHLEKYGDVTVKELEDPQISYSLSESSSVEEYSIEQQLRLGCDNQGHMYKYSIVLKKINRENINETAGALTNLAESLRKLANATPKRTYTTE
jgi:hypothetical protein